MITPEQQFINQLREFIQHGDLDRTPILEEFAEQFSELCHDICERLRRCGEYLDKGMRSEAVHETESAPHLIELAEFIQFPELKKWRNICLDLELPSFPDIPLDMVERLKKECVRERDLDPLLKQYRRAVYQGDQSECIRLLRELRQNDNGNPSWAENLAPLEEAALPGLIDRIYDALDSGDLESLRKLHEDAAHPQRVTPVPDTVLKDAENALLAERRQELALAGSGLIAELRNGLAHEQLDRVKQSLGRWEEMLLDRAFEPDASMCMEAQSAREWVEAAEEKAVDEEAFRNEVIELRALLAAGHTAPLELLQEWERLQRRGHPLPDDLEAGVGEALAVQRHRQARRKRALVAAILGLVLASAAALVAGGYYRQRQQRRGTVLATLEQLAAQQSFQELRQHLDAVRERDPGLYRSPRVQHLESTVQNELKALASREARFRSLLDELNEVRRDGYSLPEDRIRNLVDETRGAVSDDDAAGDLRAWETSWQNWRMQEMRRVNGAVEQATSLSRKALKARETEQFQSVEAEKQTQELAEQALSEAEAVSKQATEEVAKAYQDAVLAIAAWGRDIANRQRTTHQRTRDLAELRRNVRNAVPNLTVYRELLSRFVEEFPNESEATPYRRVLKQLDDCVRAEALSAFDLDGLPVDDVTETTLQGLVGEGGPLKGSVWEEDLANCLAYTRTNEQIRARVPMLIMGQKDMLDVLVLYYRKRGEQAWRPLYHTSPLTSRVDQRDEQGNEQRVFWGRVYHYDQPDQTPWLVHTSDAFPDKLSTATYEIRLQHRKQDNVVPQGRFLYGFVGEAADARELDVHLLNGIRALIKAEDIDPVPVAWLLKGFLGLLDAGFGEAIPECEGMLAAMAAVATDVPWMNPEHPGVLASAEALTVAVKSFPDLGAVIDRLRAQRQALVWSVDRKVRCIGSFQPNAEGDPVPVLVSPAPRNVWVVERDLNMNRSFFSVIGRGNGNDVVLRDAMGSGVFIGQLLFAPTDGRTCEDLLRALPGNVDKNTLQKPFSWPANRW